MRITKIVDSTTDAIVHEMDDRGLFNGIDADTVDDIIASIRFKVRDGVTEAMKVDSNT